MIAHRLVKKSKLHYDAERSGKMRIPCGTILAAGERLCVKLDGGATPLQL